MGLLIDGKWHDKWYDTNSTNGRFVRSEAQFRNWITKDGQPGPSGKGGFKAEPNRYHLYVSLACPWAHRTLIFRKLKGLENLISISVVDYLMLENGWTFSKDNPDHLFGSDYLYQIYLRADANYSGRVTVPVLWDKHKQTIVSNESSEIIRMFNGAFDDIGAAAGDYYPAALRTEIDAINDQIYQAVNNGVYRAGFATTQQAYEEAVEQLFDCLNELDELLKRQDYLVGNQLSEADWRLFTTLVRFDAVYVGHFKCNLKRIADYPNLSRYLRRLLKVPGVRDTINMTHIKRHYYMSHKTINPSGIVPLGPQLDWLD